MCKESDRKRPFTWEELAKHNSADSAYVAIRGKVRT